MAYHITYGSSVLYEAGSADRAVHDMKMGLSADGASTLDLTVPPTHPLLSSLKVHDFAHLIDVTFDGRLLFRGFITRMDVGMWNEVAIHCESELAMLGWVVESVSKPQAKTAAGMLKWCVDTFNAHMSEAVGSSWVDWLYYCPIAADDEDVGYSCEELGGATVDIETGIVTYRHAIGDTPASATDMLSPLVNGAVSKYGCLLYIDYERTTDRKTVVLRKATAGTASQTIRLGENLTDYVQQSSTEPMFTGCHASGATVTLENVFGRHVTPAQTHLETNGDKSVGATTLDVTLDSSSQEGNIAELSSGDRLVFGSTSEKGIWSVAVKGDYEITSYTLGTTIELSEPIPEFLPNGTGIGLINKEYAADARPLTLEDISNRTVTVGGRTYKKRGRYVWDTAAVSRYGLKMMSVSDSDRILASDLLMQGIHELKMVMNPSFTLQIKGVDMAMYSSNRQHLRAGDSVRVISEPHGVDEVMVVRSMTVDLDNPANTSYTIGKAIPTATGQIRGAYGAAASVKELLTRPNR